MAHVNVECPQIEDCDYTATHAEAVVLARHIGRHQYHSKKTANTATGWHPHSMEHRPPTDPGGLPLPVSVLGLLRIQEHTLPRDSGLK